MESPLEEKQFFKLSEEERQKKYNEMKERQKDNPPNQEQPQEIKEEPTLEPGKNPEDLNIDEARRFLEEAYGPEKLSVTVGAENAQKPYITETIDRSIPILKQQETTKESGNNSEVEKLKPRAENNEPTAEEKLAEKLKEEKARQERKEKALVILQDKEVMKRSPKEIIESFRNLTEDENGKHRDLDKERKELAYRNLRERGCVILIGKEAIEKDKQQAIEREKKKIEDERYADAESKYFNGLSENQLSKEEKEKYIKNGSFDKEKYLKDTIEKFGISKVVFAEMILNQHLEIQNIKKRGFLDKFFLKIVIPSSNGRESVEKTEKEFKEWIEKVVVPEANQSVLREAQLRVDQKIIANKKRMLVEKELCAKVIIQQAVGKYEAEKKLEVIVPEPTNENPSETTENLESFTINDIEKFSRQLNSNIEAQKKEQNEMKEIIKRTKQGKPLTKKQKKLLNKIDSQAKK